MNSYEITECIAAYLYSQRIAPVLLGVASKWLRKRCGYDEWAFGIAPWPLSDIAQLFGVSPRTLQIQLKDGGAAFRKNLNIERHKDLRRFPSLGASIDDTANAIGFEHRQSFSEAFVGWEGCAPSTFAKSKVLS